MCVVECTRLSIYYIKKTDWSILNDNLRGMFVNRCRFFTPSQWQSGYFWRIADENTHYLHNRTLNISILNN
jgi:hypothetical protein